MKGMYAPTARSRIAWDRGAQSPGLRSSAIPRTGIGLANIGLAITGLASLGLLGCALDATTTATAHLDDGAQAYRFLYIGPEIGVENAWVLEAETSAIHLSVSDPFQPTGTTRAWADAEAATHGLLAAINANFFHCGMTPSGRLLGPNCPGGQDAELLAASQRPLGLHCQHGECVNNTFPLNGGDLYTYHVAHLLIDGDGAPRIDPGCGPVQDPSNQSICAETNLDGVVAAVSGEPLLILDGDPYWGNASGWGGIDDFGISYAGAIPFVGLSAGSECIWLGMISGGTVHTAKSLVALFGEEGSLRGECPPIDRAIGFDSGGSSNFWHDGQMLIETQTWLPAKLGVRLRDLPPAIADTGPS